MKFLAIFLLITAVGCSGEFECSCDRKEEEFTAKAPGGVVSSSGANDFTHVCANTCLGAKQ
jgi:hypothetical protein